MNLKLIELQREIGYFWVVGFSELYFLNHAQILSYVVKFFSQVVNNMNYKVGRNSFSRKSEFFPLKYNVFFQCQTPQVIQIRKQEARKIIKHELLPKWFILYRGKCIRSFFDGGYFEISS